MDKPSATRRSLLTLPEGIELRKGARGSRLRICFVWLGKRCRETLDIPVTPSNIKYAARLRAEVLNSIERGKFDYAAMFPNSNYAKLLRPDPKKTTLVEELVNTYIDTARKTKSLSPTSIVTYARWAKARILPKWGSHNASDLTTPDLRAWIADLSTELSPKSVRNCVGFFSSVLGRAADDELIKSNPLRPIRLKTLLPKRSKSDTSKVDPFNDVEISTILNACPSPEEKALFQFAFSSGLRTGELIAIKWEHIDWLSKTIHVQDNIVSGETGTVEKTTKTDLERSVPILPGALEALETMKPLSQLLRGYIFLYPNKRIRWRDEHQIRDRWKIILRKAGVRYRNPYQTRHTFASRLLMAGEQELLVAKLLGHSTVEMVRKHYGKYIAQPEGIVLRGDYSKFGAHLGQAPQKLGANLGQDNLQKSPLTLVKRSA